MQSRGTIVYVAGLVVVCAAIGGVLWQRRAQREAEDARRFPPQQIIQIPPSGPGVPPAAPGPGLGSGGPLPGSGPASSTPPFGRGLSPMPPRIGTAPVGGPPFAGPVRQEPVVDLNTAPESALVTLPGITPDYAKAIVAHRPYRDKPDLEQKAGLPHAVVDRLGPPAMIRSTSMEPFPGRGRGRQ